MTINQSQSNDYLTHMSEDQKRRKELEDLLKKIYQFPQKEEMTREEALDFVRNRMKHRD